MVALTKSYSDVDQLREDARGWAVQYDQVGLGSFSGTLQLYQNDSVQFSRVKWNRSIHFRGDVPKGTVGFGFPLTPQPDAARYASIKVDDDHLLLQRSGGEINYMTPPTRDGLLVIVPEIAARETLGTIMDGGEGLVGGLRESKKLNHPDAERLRYLGLITSHLLQSFDEGRVSAEAIDKVCLSLQETCLRIFASNTAQKDGVRKRFKATDVVSRAEDFARNANWDYVSVLDVCRAIDVSERTLHYAFNSALGLSPSRWLRLKRLNAARRKLVNGSPSSIRVRDIALEFGFVHMGNFSLTYKRQFGEMPSETLKRPC